MGYSVIQINLEIPAVEKLKRAFQSVKCLTDYDAHSLAADAFGILVKKLSSEDASTLQGALKIEGIDTEIVADSRLPALPPSKLVNRLDCLPEGLMVYDPLGRSFVVDWNHIMLLAAGRVTLTEFNRVETRVPITHYTSDGHSYTTMESDIRTREERNEQQIMEIVLTQGVMRYSIQADKFNYQYLGELKSHDTTLNFHRLVQDICRFSRGMVLNRGSYYIKEGVQDGFYYPTKNAFFEELIWLIWRWEKSQRMAS